MKRTINENEIGVLIEKGTFVRTLTAGQHRYSPVFKKQRIETFDIRPRYTMIADNLLTADQASITITATLGYRIQDPLTYLRTVANDDSAIRTVVSELLRSAVISLPLDELLEKQGEVQKTITSELKPKLQAYGFALEILSPLNIVIPRNLKQAVEATLIARKKSQADLEEARGRTAVLRHYANAAKLVSDQPDLLKLLLGQKAKSLQVQFSDTSKAQQK